MNATDNPNAGGQTSEENLSVDELVSLRLGGESETEEQSEVETGSENEEVEESEEQSEESEAAEGEETEEAEEESEGEEEEAEVDLLDLTPEQIQALAKKGKSRLLERIGELTAKNKALEEKLTTGQAQTQAPAVAPDSNPFREITDISAIDAKQKELEATLETTDALLEDYEGYGPDDIITVGNREFTKKQIRQANRNARDAITKFLPAQRSQIQKIAQFSALSEKYREAAFKEVPEINDDKSEVSKQFKALVSDPLVERVKKEIPELGMQFEYLLAHAARSIFGGKKSVATGAGMKLKAKPPASPGGAGTARTMKPKEVKTQEATGRFMQSGSVEDLIAARIAKFAK